MLWSCFAPKFGTFGGDQVRHTHRTIGWCPEVLDSCNVYSNRPPSCCETFKLKCSSNLSDGTLPFLFKKILGLHANMWNHWSFRWSEVIRGQFATHFSSQFVLNLPYQPLFQQVPLEHPKPLPPQKKHPASCNVDNLSSCNMSISNIKVRTDSSNKALDSCISSQWAAIVSNGILLGGSP